MNNIEIFALIVIAIGFVATTAIRIKKAKDAAKDKYDVWDALFDFTEEAVEAAKMALEVNKIKRKDFESDEVYEEAVLKLSSIYIKKTLKEFVPPSLFEALTDQMINDFTKVIYEKYKNEITSVKNEKKTIKEKTDISKGIKEFYKEEK